MPAHYYSATSYNPRNPRMPFQNGKLKNYDLRPCRPHNIIIFSSLWVTGSLGAFIVTWGPDNSPGTAKYTATDNNRVALPCKGYPIRYARATVVVGGSSVDVEASVGWYDRWGGGFRVLFVSHSRKTIVILYNVILHHSKRPSVTLLGPRARNDIDFDDIDPLRPLPHTAIDLYSAGRVKLHSRRGGGCFIERCLKFPLVWNFFLV